MSVVFMLWLLLVTKCTVADENVSDLFKERTTVKNINADDTQPAIFETGALTTPDSNIEIDSTTNSRKNASHVTYNKSGEETNGPFTSITMDVNIDDSEELDWSLSDDSNIDTTTKSSLDDYTVSIKDIIDGKLNTKLPEDDRNGVSVIQKWLKLENETKSTTIGYNNFEYDYTINTEENVKSSDYENYDSIDYESKGTVHTEESSIITSTVSTSLNSDELTDFETPEATTIYSTTVMKPTTITTYPEENVPTTVFPITESETTTTISTKSATITTENPTTTEKSTTTNLVTTTTTKYNLSQDEFIASNNPDDILESEYSELDAVSALKVEELLHMMENKNSNSEMTPTESSTSKITEVSSESVSSEVTDSKIIAKVDELIQDLEKEIKQEEFQKKILEDAVNKEEEKAQLEEDILENISNAKSKLNESVDKTSLLTNEDRTILDLNTPEEDESAMTDYDKLKNENIELQNEIAQETNKNAKDLIKEVEDTIETSNKEINDKYYDEIIKDVEEMIEHAEHNNDSDEQILDTDEHVESNARDEDNNIHSVEEKTGIEGKVKKQENIENITEHFDYIKDNNKANQAKKTANNGSKIVFVNSNEPIVFGDNISNPEDKIFNVEEETVNINGNPVKTEANIYTFKESNNKQLPDHKKEIIEQLIKEETHQLNSKESEKTVDVKIVDKKTNDISTTIDILKENFKVTTDTSSSFESDYSISEDNDSSPVSVESILKRLEQESSGIIINSIDDSLDVESSSIEENIAETTSESIPTSVTETADIEILKNNDELISRNTNRLIQTSTETADQTIFRKEIDQPLHNLKITPDFVSAEETTNSAMYTNPYKAYTYEDMEFTTDLNNLNTDTPIHINSEMDSDYLIESATTIENEVTSVQNEIDNDFTSTDVDTLVNNGWERSDISTTFTPDPTKITTQSQKESILEQIEETTDYFDITNLDATTIRYVFNGKIEFLTTTQSNLIEKNNKTNSNDSLETTKFSELSGTDIVEQYYNLLMKKLENTSQNLEEWTSSAVTDPLETLDPEDFTTESNLGEFEDKLSNLDTLSSTTATPSTLPTEHNIISSTEFNQVLNTKTTQEESNPLIEVTTSHILNDKKFNEINVITSNTLNEGNDKHLITLSGPSKDNAKFDESSEENFSSLYDVIANSDSIDEISKFEDEFDKDLQEIDHILDASEDTEDERIIEEKIESVFANIRDDSGEKCMTANLSIRININDTEVMVPSNAYILGNCSTEKQHIKLTWNSTIVGINNSIYFVIKMNDEGGRFIQLAQINLYNPEDKEMIIAERELDVFDEDAYFGDITFGHGITMQFLNSEFKYSELYDFDAPTSLDSANALALQVASGSLCVLIVLIAIGIFSYKRYRSKTRIFKVSLEK